MTGTEWEEEVDCMKENLTRRSQREPSEQSCLLSRDSTLHIIRQQLVELLQPVFFHIVSADN